MNTDIEILHSKLIRLGDFYPLKRSIGDIDSAIFELENNKDLWREYNPRKENRRYGLSLTSLDGGSSGVPDLDSIREYNKKKGTSYVELSFRLKTAFFKRSKIFRDIVSPWEKYLGRSHIIRLDEGGFFPWHRDSYGMNASTFRLISLFPGNFMDTVLLLEDDVVKYIPGQLYFMNTCKRHSVVSFSNNQYLTVFNVEICEESISSVIDNLKAQ